VRPRHPVCPARRSAGPFLSGGFSQDRAGGGGVTKPLFQFLQKAGGPGRETIISEQVDARFLTCWGSDGDNDPTAIKDVLSPTQRQERRLELSETRRGAPGRRQAVLIYGFDDPQYPLERTIQAFELIARSALGQIDCTLGPRHEAPFADLIHPCHKHGMVVRLGDPPGARGVKPGHGPGAGLPARARLTASRRIQRRRVSRRKASCSSSASSSSVL